MIYMQLRYYQWIYMWHHRMFKMLIKNIMSLMWGLGGIRYASFTKLGKSLG